MFDCRRDGTDVVVHVGTGALCPKSEWLFRLDTTMEACAAVMADHLNDRMRRKLERMRKEAYDQGWKDGKSKKRKRQYHSQVWD